MLVPTLILAVCIAVLGAVAMLGTRSLTRPVTGAVMYVVLPLAAAAAFMVLGSASGG